MLLVFAACVTQVRPGSPKEFPFPVSLPSSVTTIGIVNHESSGSHLFELQGRKEFVEGEKWSGHVRVGNVGPRDTAFIATLEHSLIKQTGWEFVFRDENRNPPISTLRRSLGGEILLIGLEGWPDDVTVTLVHRR